MVLQEEELTYEVTSVGVYIGGVGFVRMVFLIIYIKTWRRSKSCAHFKLTERSKLGCVSQYVCRTKGSSLKNRGNKMGLA